MSERPMLRVVKGDPTPEELAAVVAVVTARAAAGVDPAATSGPRLDLAYGLRKPLLIGPGAWVASGWVPGTRTKASW
ncbi:MAG: acyl-CoA carboxylase subunit epsilon [Actinomycetes bacterium]